MNYEMDNQKYMASIEKIDNLINNVNMFYKYVDRTALSVI